MGADAPSVFVWISNRIQIWDGRQNVAVDIQKSLCGGRNAENLIDSRSFLSKTLVKYTLFVQNLANSACFTMTIVQY